MSKAILILDKPENCYDCPCYDGEYDYCLVTGLSRDYETGIIGGCPLVEVSIPKYWNDDNVPVLRIPIFKEMIEC